MSWGDIVGQQLALRLLRQAVATGKVAHAYLFTGPDGVGKRMVAMELAKALNCQRPGPEGSACDQCLPCRKLAQTPPVHPDLAIVEPEGRFIKTDQMRALQTDMYARPSEGRVRVAIIDGADQMNAESGNRLLKLLEEPPAYAIMLLLTQNLAGVLPTLVSRCQVVNFPPASPEEAAKVLHSRLGLDSSQSRLFAALSGGSIGRAMRMAQDATLTALRDETSELLEQLGQADDIALLTRAETLEKQKERLDEWLELLTIWLRDALLVAQTGSELLVLNQDRIQTVRSLANACGVPRLLAMLETVIEARGQIRRNANTRLVLDVMIIRLADMCQGRSVNTDSRSVM